MIIDQPIVWGPTVEKDAVLDCVSAHQRMTKVNPAMAAHFRAKPADRIGMTPSDFFRFCPEQLAVGPRLLQPAVMRLSEPSQDPECVRIEFKGVRPHSPHSPASPAARLTAQWLGNGSHFL